MRHVILLAVLTTATPALANDCPPEQDTAVWQLDSLRVLWQRLQGIVRTGRVSNGLAHVHDGRDSKTPYAVEPTRDECSPGRTPTNTTPMDPIFE
jgi:hypothetical protein